MYKVFITYGDGNFKATLKRVRSEALALHVFDKVIVYTPKDLECDIGGFVTKYSDRGGGYWIWKPYLILKTLQKYPDAVVVYADAGCTLNANIPEWNRWFELMSENQLLVTRYRRNVDYGWEQTFGTNSVAIETWTRKMVMDFFDGLFRHRQWHQNEKLLAGFMMVRMGAKPLLQEWLGLMYLHPEFLVDMQEEKEQYSSFIMHRHDQSLLTALVYYYKEKKDFPIAILQETAESDNNAAVVATRKRGVDKSTKSNVIHLLKSLFGEKTYSVFHFWK